MKRYDQALACCRQALSLKTDFAAAMNNQGLALENLGRLERGDATAEEAFTAVISHWPHDPLAAYHLQRLRRGESGVMITLADK